MYFNVQRIYKHIFCTCIIYTCKFHINRQTIRAQTASLPYRRRVQKSSMRRIGFDIGFIDKNVLNLRL